MRGPVMTDKITKKLKCKQRLVVMMYVIGFSLLAIATYAFSYKIPKFNEELSSLQTEGRSSLFSNIEFQLQQHNIQMLCALHDILYEVNPESIRIKPFYNQITHYQQTLLKHTFHELTGKYPDEKELQNWAGMNAKQLERELYRIHLEHSDELSNVGGGIVGVYKKERSKKFSKLEDTKNIWLFWSILAQILGLAINQIAIVLEVSWNP